MPRGRVQKVPGQPPRLPRLSDRQKARDLSRLVMPPAGELRGASEVTPQEFSRAVRARALLLRRQREALRQYEPMPKQLAFHQSQAPTRIIGGGNQSGKTQAAAAEVSWILTGTHPFDRSLPKENGIFYAVGYDEKHVSDLMWQKLGRPGAFRLIRDEQTRAWRVWKPWQPYDEAHAEKTVEAEPFLPERFIRSISWESRKDDCPRMIKMKNGWRIRFYTSKGHPQKGTEINGFWFDEEMERDGWFGECRARCLKRGGRGFWSATPEISTPQFFRLYQQAAKDAREGIGLVEKYWLSLEENPYISARQKAEFKASLPERLVRVKYYGEFALTGLLVYPEFSTAQHCVSSHVLSPSWSRYMVVDPGVQVCAVLFAAVPPEEQSVHVYKELYIKRCSARIFGHDVAQAMGEYRNAFEAFLIDMSMGRQTELGSGKTVVTHYAEALEQNQVFSRQTHNGFIAGSPDVPAREESLRRWLEINPRTGQPTLRIHEGSCPYLIWEIEQQYYDRTKGEANDRKRLKQNDHLVNCLEYLAHYDPGWHKPPPPEEWESPIEVYLREKTERINKRNGSEGVRLGPTF